jgi:hypothetical protein
MNKTQPYHDSIVAELHAIRQHFAEQYHNDLVAYSQAAETHCRALGFQMVDSPRLPRSHSEMAKTESANTRS